jgi:hypothetical protein
MVIGIFNARESAQTDPLSKNLDIWGSSLLLVGRLIVHSQNQQASYAIESLKM